MAQILKEPDRISQVLPSVKCSNCNFPVPLDELGDHVCATPPPVPTLPKPTISPNSAVSLLPTRLQNLVSPRSSRSPASAQPSPSSPRLAAQDRASQQQRRGQPNHPPGSSNAALSPGWNQNQHIQSPLSRTPLRETHTQERARTPDTLPSPLSRPNPQRVPTPVRDVYSQDRARSSSATQTSFSRPDAGLRDRDAYAQDRARASSATLNFFPRSEMPKATTPVREAYSQERSRTPPATQRGREPYSPLVNSSPLRHGSPSNAGSVSHHTARPSENVAHPSPLHTTYAPPRDSDIDTKIGGEAGMAGVGRRGFAAAARAAMTDSGDPRSAGQRAFTPSNGTGDPNIPRHIPGMDGRRANAPAYLNIASLHPGTPPLSPNSHSSPSHSPSPISPPVFPPANSNDQNSVAPSRSPSPLARDMPPSESRIASINSADPIHGSALNTPRLPFFEKYKNKLPGVSNNSPNASPPAMIRTRTPQPETKVPSVIEEHRRIRSNGSNRIGPTPPSPSLESEFGLAYADSTGSEGEQDLQQEAKSYTKAPLSDRRTEGLSNSISSGSGRSNRSGNSQSDKHGLASAGRPSGPTQVPTHGQGQYSGASRGSEMTRDRSGSLNSVSGRDRSPSSASGSSAYSKSTGTRTGTGGLESAMETLLEDIASTPNLPGSISAGLAKSKSSSSTTSNNSNTLATSAAGKSYRSKTIRSPETKALKLPARSRTSPTTARDSGNGSKRYAKIADTERTSEKRMRECIRCRKNIDDGRWIQMDGGSILCEGCWKNMYLPKCRRCELPIENQAVSSSDGQLKGKYHRACFNCHTCHKPFPDKTFYVFDGKPLCAYHYHEANNSLCSAAKCGQPIEGPCAVSHSGDRYHPEHFLCEYAGYRPCHERLVEYWEVDGMMLCERHANKEMDADADVDMSPTPSTRAMKRVTRFIDLAGGGGAGTGSNAF